MDNAFPTHREALENRNNDDLKKFLALLPTKERATQKAKLVALIEGEMAGEKLRQLYEQLDKVQQQALSEVVWSEEAFFRSDRFGAKYGASPLFSEKKEVDRGWGYHRGNPTLICLFLFTVDRHSNSVPGWITARDLQKRLQAFVPHPPALRLNTVEELPESVEREEKEWELADDDTGQILIHKSGTYVRPSKQPKITKTVHQIQLNRRNTERDAAQELPALLRLIDKGKVSASDKTFQPSASTMQEITTILRDGDYYDPKPKQDKWDQEVGPIKAFAWPMMMQAAKLAELSDKKLALTKAGRSALSVQPAETLRLIWQRWLKSKLLDEFNRIEIIKGKGYRSGRNITAVEPRRAVLNEALKQCPVGEWVRIDDFFSYLKAAEFDFEVARESVFLYVEDQQYGHLGGYGHQTDWLMLQGRYTICLLFEYAATLGMIDVAYVDPTKARNDWSELWGVDDLDFFSRYDGLLYFRLNPLGAYCLELTDQYTPQQIEARARLTVLPSLRINISGGALSLDEAMLLETWAEKGSDNIWQLSQEKAIQVIETGGQISELHQFLKARDEQELPPTVEGFIATTERRARACKEKGKALLIECASPEIAEQIAVHEKMKKLCQRAGEKNLVVMADAEEQFRKALRLMGYGMPRV